MTGEQIYKFIRPHLGIIDATGNHSRDIEKLENFKVRRELLECLLEDIEVAYLNSKDSYEESVQLIATECFEDMQEITERFRDYIYTDGGI